MKPSRPGLSLILLFAFLVVSFSTAFAQAPQNFVNRNRPERVEWFRDAGFGLFIHWSVDSPLGSVISHSLVGASRDYIDRFFRLLPEAFYPQRFDPREWAQLARLAGMKYVVFTTKHHAGFCMYHTRTTPFNVKNTPFRRDIFAEVAAAFREQGIAVGVYFSPDDFWFLHQQGKTIARRVPGVDPPENPALMRYDLAQLRELMTNYGPIDVLFLDGAPEGLRELAWDLQPHVVVTRGAMETPEQYIPGIPLDGAWEACLTMGTQWAYKPTNETYKSGRELIRTLIETRAKGGNLLLNVGPKPDGTLPIEQEERLREIALWHFINGESIDAVRPWVITNENDIWFTRKKNQNTLYVFLTESPWRLGDRKEFLLRSVKSSGLTEISVLGQSGEVLEYVPDADVKSRFTQTPEGLRISVARAQRIYNDRRWPNPVVVKLTNVVPALTPPVVETLAPRWDSAARAAVLTADLKTLGEAPQVEVGFQYRPKKGVTDLYERTQPWTDIPPVSRTQPGTVSINFSGFPAGQVVEVRALVKHPLITLYGSERDLSVP